MSNDAVTVDYPQEGVARVCMQDENSKNTFSQELIQGLMTVFASIQDNQDAKVVVIHGFDNYFCCGGTKEELLRIYHREVTFADMAFYRLLLDCPVPTIAAMQGHALGGGLAFGCYADVIILGEENIYSTNFMKYGFTPGMGSTYIVPRKLGELLGNEMLSTAKNYRGIDLKAYAAPVRIVPKSEVLDLAFDLAVEYVDKPRASLMLLKKQLTRQIVAELPEVIEQELAMHEETFHLPEVKERIESLFGK